MEQQKPAEQTPQPEQGRLTHNSEIEKRFTYHAPHGDQAEKYTRLRTAGKALAYTIVELTPDSREQSLALTHLEEAIMQANAAIARRE